MKILLLELSGSDPVSRYPSKYGGAGISLRRLAESLDNCYIAAEESCFEEDLTDKCIPLSHNTIQGIKDNFNVNDYINFNSFDLIIYDNPGLILYTQKPQICWAPGAYEEIHPEIKHLLLHNPKWQKPIIKNPDTKIHEFVLGIDIPEFQEYQKEDFVFSCGNQYPQVNSHILANWAVKNKIKIVFAGPIDPTYKKTFLNEIDYNWATYIGQIDEEEKIKLMKKARCYVDLVSHHLNGPRLGTKQAWSYGCSVISTPMGIMMETVKNEINGFIITNENEFLNAAINLSKNINQKDCWETSTQWSVEKMVASFNGIINIIMKDHNV